MDDIGTYVYLAFLIISLVAGLIRNRKKKSEEESQQEETQSRPMPDFGEILARQRAQQEEAQQRLREMEARAAQVKVENSTRRATQGSRLREKRNEAAEENLSEPAVNAHSDFDPAKAIIYSEIIKNPHL